MKKFNIIQDLNLPTYHAALSLTLAGLETPLQVTLQRAKQLGSYDQENVNPKTRQRPIPAKHVNPAIFRENLQLPMEQVEWNNNTNVDNLCTVLADTIYTAAKKSATNPRQYQYHSPSNATNRWNNILQEGDEKKLWASINWKGNFDTETTEDSNKPNDDEFCKHFQTLLNPAGAEDPRDNIPQEYRYIPVLDDSIQADEVARCIDSLKPNKSAGVDGISPGIMKYLPMNWIVLLTTLLTLLMTWFLITVSPSGTAHG